jgi:hypothetical protein
MSRLQMAQLMQEREQETWDALDRLYEAGAKLDDLKTLAREAGCSGWRPKETNAHVRSANVG